MEAYHFILDNWGSLDAYFVNGMTEGEVRDMLKFLLHTEGYTTDEIDEVVTDYRVISLFKTKGVH